jgi:UrcA family protein
MSKILAIAALALSPSLADAGQHASLPSVSVPVIDLDLRSGAGLKRLQSRLDSAVRTLCPAPTSHNVIAHRAFRDCQRDTNRSAAHARELALARSVGRVELAARSR